MIVKQKEGVSSFNKPFSNSQSIFMLSLLAMMAITSCNQMYYLPQESSPGKEPVVKEHTCFKSGFTPDTGILICTDGRKMTILSEKLNRHTAVIHIGQGTYAVRGFR